MKVRVPRSQLGGALVAALSVVTGGSLSAQTPAAVLMEADAPVTVFFATGDQLGAPAPFLALSPGDSVVVGGDGYALILYPGGPAKVWPGEAHVVADVSTGAQEAEGETLWQQISTTVAAFVGAPEERPAEARHGVSRADGDTGVHVLVRDGATILATRPRFLIARDERRADDEPMEIVIFGGLDPRRCWRGGTPHWEGLAVGSEVTVGSVDRALENGEFYRIQITAEDGERDSACFQVADEDTQERLRIRRALIAEEFADATQSVDVLWSLLLAGEGFEEDALQAVYSVLDQRPMTPVEMLLRDSLRERIMAGRP